MCGEMAELVEGARLEIVYGRNVIKGSNPFLSAKQKRSSQGWSFLFAEQGAGWAALPPAQLQCRMANALLSAKFKLCLKLFNNHCTRQYDNTTKTGTFQSTMNNMVHIKSCQKVARLYFLMECIKHAYRVAQPKQHRHGKIY